MAAQSETDHYSKNVYYIKLDEIEKELFQKWIIKNTGGTPEQFYNLREKAKRKASTKPTEGFTRHDGVFTPETMVNRVGQDNYLNEEYKNFIRELYDRGDGF